MESTTKGKVKNTSKICFLLQLGDVVSCCHTLLLPKGHVQMAKEIYYQFPVCCPLAVKVACCIKTLEHLVLFLPVQLPIQQLLWQQW